MTGESLALQFQGLCSKLLAPRMQQWAGFVLFSGLSQALITISLWLAGRALAVEEYGRYMANWALIVQVAVLWNFGLDTWLLREAVGAESSDRLNGALFTKIIAWLVLLPLTMALAPMLRRSLYSSPLLALAGAAALFLGIGNAMVAFLQAQARARLAGFLRGLSGLLVLLLILAPYWLGANTAEVFMAARAAALLLATLLGLTFIRSADWHSGRHFSLLWREGLPYVGSDVFAQVYANADLVLLGFLAGERVVGIYTPASIIINGLIFVPAAIYSLLIPYLTDLRHNRPARLRRVLTITTMGMICLGALMALALWLGKGFIINSIYGREYAESATALGWLCGLLVPKSLSFAFAAYITACGKQRARTRVQGAIAALNLAGNFVLIPSLGWLGAAIAYWGSELVLVIIYGLLARRNLPDGWQKV